MLQELTENDFKHVNSGTSTKNLLVIYNLIKENVELDLKNNFYFDDKFYWNKNYIDKIKKELRKDMVSYNDFYCGQITWSRIENELNKKIFRIVNDKKLLGRYIDSYTIERYIRVILNKLRPDDEYYKNYLEKEMKNSFQKKQAEILEREKIRQVSISEEEKEGNKIADYIAEQKINEKKNYNYKKVANAFIYGIYIDNKLVYIGKTTREMKNRLGEHLECALLGEGGGAQQNYLYKAMRECEVGYKFKILYESYNTISNHELEEIEKTLIENLQPEFNYEGVKVPYRFSEEKR